MTPEVQQALQLIDAVAAQAPVSRDVHVAAQKALQALAKALEGPQKAEVPEGDTQ